MKIKITIAAISLCITMTGFSVRAQENDMTDPILKFKNGYEIGLSANGTRVNTNYTHFETTHGRYDFKKIITCRGWMQTLTIVGYSKPRMNRTFGSSSQE
jgi:hypothetical protein